MVKGICVELNDGKVQPKEDETEEPHTSVENVRVQYMASELTYLPSALERSLCYNRFVPTRLFILNDRTESEEGNLQKPKITIRAHECISRRL
jgi:hypothetical protein